MTLKSDDSDLSGKRLCTIEVEQGCEEAIISENLLLETIISPALIRLRNFRTMPRLLLRSYGNPLSLVNGVSGAVYTGGGPDCGEFFYLRGYRREDMAVPCYVFPYCSQCAKVVLLYLARGSFH